MADIPMDLKLSNSLSKLRRELKKKRNKIYDVKINNIKVKYDSLTNKVANSTLEPKDRYKMDLKLSKLARKIQYLKQRKMMTKLSKSEIDVIDSKIYYRCSDGYYQSNGITSISDLHLKIGVNPLGIRLKYDDPDTLDIVILAVHNFIDKFERRPTTKDPLFQKISKAIQEQRLEPSRLKTFDDLIFLALQSFQFNLDPDLNPYLQLLLEFLHQGFDQKRFHAKKPDLVRSLKVFFSIDPPLCDVTDHNNFLNLFYTPIKNFYPGEIGLQRIWFVFQYYLILSRINGNEDYPIYDQIPTISDRVNENKYSNFGISSMDDLYTYFGYQYSRKFEQSPYLGKAGLLKAKKEVKHYYQMSNEYPSTSDFSVFSQLLYRGEYKNMKPPIETWEEFLVYCDIKYVIQTPELHLEELKTQITNYYNDHGNPPVLKNDTVNLYPIYSGKFSDLGINSYNELLNELGLPLNNTWGEYREFTRQDVLELVDDFIDEYGRTPTTRDLPYLSYLINSNKINGIKDMTFTYFLKDSGYEVNVVPRGYWETEEGFNEAITKLKQYYDIHGCRPSISDLHKDYLGIVGILPCISREVWTHKGIYGIADLFEYAGIPREVRESGFWHRDDAINEVLEMVLAHFVESGCFPVTHELPGGFVSVANSGYYQSKYGFATAAEFLRKISVLHKTPDGTYIGKDGLDQAAKEIIRYYLRKGKWPKSDQLSRIKGKIYVRFDYGRRWSQFGVEKWGELINYAKKYKKEFEIESEDDLELQIIKTECFYCHKKVKREVHVCMDKKCIQQFKYETFKV